jgi:hypothetical protein
LNTKIYSVSRVLNEIACNWNNGEEVAIRNKTFLITLVLDEESSAPETGHLKNVAINNLPDSA